MSKPSTEKKLRQAQTQRRPGNEEKMKPQPVYEDLRRGSGRLKGKIALITGGDSGIGRAVAVLFAKEGADVAIGYLSETSDAKITQQEVEKFGRRCLLIKGDVSKAKFCESIIQKIIHEYGTLDILINNAAAQFEQKTLEDITDEQLELTFQTNIYSMFRITRAAIPYLKKGAVIINTASVTAYRGSPELLDYSSTKGAIISFTRSLSANLVDKGIRVNAVAPGPIWTPLIPATLNKKRVSKHGSATPMRRAGEPVEVAPSYLFLACEDSAYMTGQVLHPNGGEIING